MTLQDIEIAARDLGARVQMEGYRFLLVSAGRTVFRRNGWHEIMFFNHASGEPRKEEIDLAFQFLKGGVMKH